MKDRLPEAKVTKGESATVSTRKTFSANLEALSGLRTLLEFGCAQRLSGRRGSAIRAKSGISQLNNLRRQTHENESRNCLEGRRSADY